MLLTTDVIGQARAWAGVKICGSPTEEVKVRHLLISLEMLDQRVAFWQSHISPQ